MVKNDKVEARRRKATGYRLCKHCGYMAVYTSIINSALPGTPNQEQRINFLWPKIVPSRRRCPLVKGPNKGDFTVFIYACDQAKVFR